MSDRRIAEITLDERSVVRWNPDVDHERRVAIFDLLEQNFFAPEGCEDGPYNLHLAIQENRLVFDIRDVKDKTLTVVTLPTSPFRRIVRDYFQICESYFDAIKHASPSKIEAIDMGRRGVHDEGSVILRERLAGKVDIDFETARRLFTLICVLHLRA